MERGKENQLGGKGEWEHMSLARRAWYLCQEEWIHGLGEWVHLVPSKSETLEVAQQSDLKVFRQP